MKKLLTLVIALIIMVVLFFSTTSAYTVNTSLFDLKEKMLEHYNVSEKMKYKEGEILGFIPTSSYLGDFEIKRTSEGIDLKLTYHKKILLDFKFGISSHFELVDGKLINSGIKLSFLDLPSFLEEMVKEELKKLPLDITVLDLASIYEENESFYTVSLDDNSLFINFERSQVEDSVYKEEANKDLLEISNNEIVVKDFNHFVNNEYFLDLLLKEHNITKLYLDGDKLYLRIKKDAYEVDYVLNGEFEIKNNDINFVYYDIFKGERRLSKDEIKEFMRDNHFKFSGFKDILYFNKNILEEFINKYTGEVRVSIRSIEKINDEVIIKLSK